MQFFRRDFPLTPAFDYVRPSVKLAQQNIWPVFYLAFLPALITAVGSTLVRDIIVANKFQPVAAHHLVGLGLIAAGLLYSALTLPGLITAQLAAIRGRQPGTWDSFKAGLPRFWTMVWAAIVGQFLIFCGLIALIVPGLMLVRSFYLYQYYVVDQKLTARQALKQCRSDSIPNSGYIWETLAVVVLFSLVAYLFSGIPVVGPLLQIAITMLYVFGPALRYSEIRRRQKR